MSTQTEHETKQINRLIEATLDSADGYRDASAAASSSRFSALFEKRAVERRALVPMMQLEIRRIGGKPEEGGTILGAAQRWFAALKNSMGGSDSTIVNEVEAAEDHLKNLFETVMADAALSTEVREMITRTYGTIRADHDQIRDIKLAQDAPAAQ